MGGPERLRERGMRRALPVKVYGIFFLLANGQGAGRVEVTVCGTEP